MDENEKELEKAQRRLEAFKARLVHLDEVFRATIAIEHAVLKPIFLLNGGAVLVYLTFLGAIIGAGMKWPNDWLIPILAVVAWCGGLVCAALTSGFTWHSQFNFYKHRGREVAAEQVWDYMEGEGAQKAADAQNKLSKDYVDEGNKSRNWAKVFWASSLLLFFVGVGLAMWGGESILSPTATQPTAPAVEPLPDTQSDAPAADL